MTVQELIEALGAFWSAQGCLILPPYDTEVGAGTFTPATFLRSLGNAPFNVAYVAPSRRPTDGRYGENPNRLYKFHQYQVLLKPSPLNNQQLYLDSLKAIGLNLEKHDIRFVHDDWESPTLGAYGLGWEVWIDGMEATQYTYFQTVGQFKVHPVSVEYAYGIERLAMYIQGVDNVYDLKWNPTTSYGELFLNNEREWSKYHFEIANASMWKELFDAFEKEALSLLDEGLIQSPLDFVMKASHAFNALEARGALSVSERTGYIARIRGLSHRIAKNYLESLPPKPEIAETIQRKLPSTPHVKGETATFLLEIGSEELPASFLPGALTSLKELFEKLCAEEHIAHGEIEMHATPRRLALVAHNTATKSAPPAVERKGPPLAAAFDEGGELTQAGLGFFSACKLDPIQRLQIENHPALSVQEIKGVPYLFAVLRPEARQAAAVLQEHLSALISKIAFPKRMRWNTFTFEYARPLHWIVALFGSEVLPIEVGPILSGRTSQAHRQRRNNIAFDLQHADEYVKKLKDHDVMVNISERRARIEELLAPLHPAAMHHILAEVLYLIEWPDLVEGSFSTDFLSIPHEVLICEMEQHQKVFPLLHKGALSNRFAIICDQHPSDQIRIGNERVISARLNDGKFLYEQDLKRSLNAMRSDLKAMTFYEGLGSMYEKTERLEKHVMSLHSLLALGSLPDLVLAAKYSKADLASHLVAEFPELQGVAGSKYAEHEKHHSIARALREHWFPSREGGSLPTTPEGALLALADKLDNLILAFASDRIPTSTKDPYGLRRQAIGILRICFENKIDLPLKSALKALSAHMPVPISEETIEQLIAFILGRMEGLLLAEGFSKTEIAATIPQADVALFDLYTRLSAVHTLKASADFGNLLEVFKRVAGQVKEDKLPQFDTELVQEPAEQQLADVLAATQLRFEASCEAGDYRAALEALGALRIPLSDFFDAVRVQCDEPAVRLNRLAMLAQILNMSRTLAHIQEI